MSDNIKKNESIKNLHLEKLTQSFLRKIKELEASRTQRDNLKEEIRLLISKEKF